MTFNELVKTALSNDVICITDDILRGNVFIHDAAFKWIDNAKYKDREVDRITLVPRKLLPGYDKNDKFEAIAVTLK